MKTGTLWPSRLAYLKKWKLANPDKVKEYARIHRTRHRKKIRKLAQAWHRNNPGKHTEYSKKAYRVLREKVFALYGPQCAKCGFSHKAALQLDHISGGGNKEKTRVGVHGILRRALKFPLEYQILCANCNWIKREEKGEC